MCVVAGVVVGDVKYPQSALNFEGGHSMIAIRINGAF